MHPGTQDSTFNKTKSAQVGFLLYYPVSLSELRLWVMHLILNTIFSGTIVVLAY